MSPFERAKRRVEASPDLALHHYLLLDYKWPEGDRHYEWVATADESVLLSWVEDAERVFLKHIQKV